MQKIFELEIEGKHVGFRFNMLAFGEAARLENCNLNELFEKLGMTGNGNIPDIVTMNNFFFAAAKNYSKGKGLKIDFTEVDVSDWIDHYGFEKSLGMMTEALKVPAPKNQEAPTLSSEKTSQ